MALGDQPGAGWTTGEATPLQPHSAVRGLTTFSRDGRLNTSSNIILLYRMNELKDLAFVNFILALLTLASGAGVLWPPT